jgi:hypothetical protein
MAGILASHAWIVAVALEFAPTTFNTRTDGAASLVNHFGFAADEY